MTIQSSAANVPGTLYRVQVDTVEPALANGGSERDYVFNIGDKILQPAPWETVAMCYPALQRPRLVPLGLRRPATGATPNTAVVVDEHVGAGHVISFGPPSPYYRGYTDGTKRVLWNAIVQPLPS